MKQIYRGYGLENTDAGWAVSKDGLHIHTAQDEEAALKWVDADRRMAMQSQKSA